MSVALKVGLTPASRCQYISTENEQLAVVLSPDMHHPEGYQQLINAGFRRSGNMMYRPHCPHCNACQSLRIDVAAYQPSKSQKRHRSQLKRLRVKVSDQLDPNWFSLYDQYITARHADGNMYPAKAEDFIAFTHSDWLHPCFIHLYDPDGGEETLVAIAVTDVLSDGLSALYSFFDPFHRFSLGRVCIQAQLEYASAEKKSWLYLGYQIDDCPAMRYKADYFPHQRFINHQWRLFSLPISTA
ncbi:MULTISPECIES: arginyltransferase [unclassified Salinivibrio]|uniref:arginyltransferase n=1 Tax=unclassified Salinivibrio TaxID=2636825 RepID=UPI000985D085|nr:MULTISPECIES: arginyltransferase [unclassified Salinivibrio]OOF13397.1 arginyltransferase [Salinivibrio sp. PR919]OOF16939.1 arginyltransferase [Salinivibrio sp. PR932]